MGRYDRREWADIRKKTLVPDLFARIERSGRHCLRATPLDTEDRKNLSQTQLRSDQPMPTLRQTI
jgi:hypothetical protein